MTINNLLLNFQFKQRTLMTLCGVMVMCILLTIGYISLQWRADWQLAHREMAGEPTKAIADESSNIIAAIPEQHLFGEAITKVGEMPITNLQLKVTGIVKKESDNDKSNSKAYISISGQQSKIYHVGDKLPYGVKVYAVLNNAVILENNGRLEKLLLPREPLQFKTKISKESM